MRRAASWSSGRDEAGEIAYRFSVMPTWASGPLRPDRVHGETVAEQQVVRGPDGGGWVTPPGRVITRARTRGRTSTTVR